MTFSFMTGFITVFDSLDLSYTLLLPSVFTVHFYHFAIRCGHLTSKISLPYSIIGQGHVEGAIKEAYCNRICGDCIHEV